MKPIILVMVLAMNTSCITETAQTGEDQCGASELQHLIGENGSVLDSMKFAGPVRILEPGQAMTMDYSVERLNIQLDDSGMISRVWCG